MSGISAYEHRLAALYHDGVRQLPGVTVFGPDFTSRVRAPTVSITLAANTAARSGERTGRARRVRVGWGFLRGAGVEVLGLAERGGLLRTGISMYSSESDVRRLLDGLSRLTDRESAASRGPPMP